LLATPNWMGPFSLARAIYLRDRETMGSTA
jgi:hypothetical protein